MHVSCSKEQALGLSVKSGKTGRSSRVKLAKSRHEFNMLICMKLQTYLILTALIPQSANNAVSQIKKVLKRLMVIDESPYRMCLKVLCCILTQFAANIRLKMRKKH